MQAPAAAEQPPHVREELTPDVVLATIRTRYLGGVERCYRRQLKKDATARGRVRVSFAVDPKGRVFEGEARGITEQVDDCITAQIAKWRFPRPSEEARFALGLELGAN
jgi:hypothetical protein